MSKYDKLNYVLKLTKEYESNSRTNMSTTFFIWLMGFSLEFKKTFVIKLSYDYETP